MEVRYSNALVSYGSSSYTVGSSSSESESYFHRSEVSGSALGFGARPRLSIHSRPRRPIRRRKAGWLAGSDSCTGKPALNWKTGIGGGLYTSIRSCASSISIESEDIEAGGVIRYCVLAGRNFSSMPCSFTGDSGPVVRSMWFWFHLRWLAILFSRSKRSSLSFSTCLSASVMRSASMVRPSGLVGWRCGPAGRCIARFSMGLRFWGWRVS